MPAHTRRRPPSMPLPRRPALAARSASLIALLSACGEHTGDDPHAHGPDAARADAASAGPETPRPAHIEPGPGPELPQPPLLVDRDPAPDVLDVELTAREATAEYLPGRPTAVWGYDGQVPGPLLRARRGDRVIVRFRNDLPTATTIHWHGLRVPLEMDGVPVAGGIAPGGAFVYDFVVPDAGTFWFHPHVRSDEQVERGLYAPIIVDDPDEPAVLTGLTERVLVLDDVLLEADGTLADFDYTDDDAPLGAHAAHMGTVMLGRQGNLLLVNGAAHPTLTLDRGRPERWRLINAANARYLRLVAPGWRLTRIAGDAGLLPAPEPVDDGGLLLVPGARTELLVEATDATPATSTLTALPHDRGHGTGDAPAVVLATLNATGRAPEAPLALPQGLRSIDPLGPPVTRATLVLSEKVASPGGHAGHGDSGAATGDETAAPEPVFLINDEVFPDVTPLTAAVGDVVEWAVVNDSEMSHPFHLHGFSFQVVPGDVGAGALAGWYDTVDVPGKATLHLRFQPDDRPGLWMYHCHILEHAERGMIGLVDVTAR